MVKVDIAVVRQNDRLMRATEKALEAVRDSSSRRRSGAAIDGKDPDATFYSGGYIGRAIVALLHGGQLGVGSGRLYVAEDPRQAYPYATKWVIDADARKEAVLYTVDRLRALGVSERDVEAYLMHPTVFAFGENTILKLVRTNSDRGYLATKPGKYISLSDMTRRNREEHREVFGVDFVELLQEAQE